MSDIIVYSTKAKAHDLALLNLKSQDISNLSSEELTNKYLENYKKIYEILENDRKENSNAKIKFE